MTDMKEFDHEHQYKLFLIRMNLEKKGMPDNQKKVMRQTFIRACGQILVVMRDEITRFVEDQAIEIMEDMWKQVYKVLSQPEQRGKRQG